MFDGVYDGDFITHSLDALSDKEPSFVVIMPLTFRGNQLHCFLRDNVATFAVELLSKLQNIISE